MPHPGTEPLVKRPFRKKAKLVAWSGLREVDHPEFDLTRLSLTSDNKWSFNANLGSLGTLHLGRGTPSLTCLPKDSEVSCLVRTP